jgi:DNA/RNA endonuclease YhcR with UshA esterase domain
MLFALKYRIVPVLVAVLLLGALCPAAAPLVQAQSGGSSENTSDPIPWDKVTREHLGKEITVKGTVVKTRNTGKVCFLNFQQDHRTGFYIVIFEDALDDFEAPPEAHFLNKMIHVTGRVSEHKERLQIQVKAGSQIKIVE